MKVTKTNIRMFVKQKLSSDRKWATKALVRIYNENQTADEKFSNSTFYDNGIGFSGADGELLSSFAKQFIQRKSLSEKQMALVMKKMPKYWNQVVYMADEAKLKSMVEEHQHSTQTKISF